MTNPPSPSSETGSLVYGQIECTAVVSCQGPAVAFFCQACTKTSSYDADKVSAPWDANVFTTSCDTKKENDQWIASLSTPLL